MRKTRSQTNAKRDSITSSLHQNREEVIAKIEEIFEDIVDSILSDDNEMVIPYQSRSHKRQIDGQYQIPQAAPAAFPAKSDVENVKFGTM